MKFVSAKKLYMLIIIILRVYYSTPLLSECFFSYISLTVLSFMKIYVLKSLYRFNSYVYIYEVSVNVNEYRNRELSIKN